MKALLSLILLSAMSVSAQSTRKPTTPKVDLDALTDKIAASNYAQASYRGSHKVKFFEDDPRNARFELITSWIPGSDNKGLFRYKVNVEIEPPTAEDKALFTQTPPKGGWGIPESLDRLQRCGFTLRLLDEGGFILQKIPITLIKTVDDKGIVASLNDNDSSPMQFSEYKSFMAATPTGSWELTWRCP